MLCLFVRLIRGCCFKPVLVVGRCCFNSQIANAHEDIANARDEIANAYEGDRQRTKEIANAHEEIYGLILS